MQKELITLCIWFASAIWFVWFVTLEPIGGRLLNEVARIEQCTPKVYEKLEVDINSLVVPYRIQAMWANTDKPRRISEAFKKKAIDGSVF